MTTRATSIEDLAADCAREHMAQGATAPFGDGETCLGGDWDALCELLDRWPLRHELRVWDDAFRTALGE